MDKYRNFKEMAEKESGRFSIKSGDRDAKITIAAIHGGMEPGTERIAQELSDYNTYVFEAFGPDAWGLHITSNNYREEMLEMLLGKSDACLSLHGLHGKDEAVYISSSNPELEVLVRESLEKSGFEVKDYHPMEEENFVNLAERGGVQLELTRGLRDAMFEGGAKGSRKTEKFRQFCKSLKEAIGEYLVY